MLLVFCSDARFKSLGSGLRYFIDRCTRILARGNPGAFLGSLAFSVTSGFFPLLCDVVGLKVAWYGLTALIVFNFRDLFHEPA